MKDSFDSQSVSGAYEEIVEAFSSAPVIAPWIVDALEGPSPLGSGIETGSVSISRMIDQ